MNITLTPSKVRAIAGGTVLGGAVAGAITGKVLPSDGTSSAGHQFLLNAHTGAIAAMGVAFLAHRGISPIAGLVGAAAGLAYTGAKLGFEHLDQR